MNLNFNHEGKRIDFNVTYQKRKTLSIHVESSGTVAVTAPYRTSQDTILEIVKKKADWINKKLLDMEERRYLKPEHEYIEGESFQYIGTSYSLRIIVNNSIRKPSIRIDGNLIYLMISEDDPVKVKNSLEKWYKEAAKVKILERLKYYEGYFKFSPNSFKVKEQKKRWGSCNSNRDLFFNWRLIMAPVNIIDYVVVHEMCHMQHMNHSRDFWNLVESILPDYKFRRDWLKNNGFILSM